MAVCNESASEIWPPTIVTAGPILEMGLASASGVGDEIFGIIPKRSTGRLMQNDLSFHVILVNSNGEIMSLELRRRYSIKRCLNTRRFITTSSGPKKKGDGAVPPFLGSGDGNPS